MVCISILAFHEAVHLDIGRGAEVVQISVGLRSFRKGRFASHIRVAEIETRLHHGKDALSAVE